MKTRGKKSTDDYANDILEAMWLANDCKPGYLTERDDRRSARDKLCKAVAEIVGKAIRSSHEG